MNSQFPVLYDYDHLKDQVILGPCPGCELWTLQYDKLQVLDIFPTIHDFHNYVESLLREHLADCPGLQEIAKEKGIDTP